jgi:type IV secretion system protein VirB10
MTDEKDGPPDITPDLRLRPERPRVTRLSRRVLLGLALIVTLGLGAATIFALQTQRGNRESKELFATEIRATTDRLAGLPRDYSEIPKLGPPLPGDLGRPILSAQTQGHVVPQDPLSQPVTTPDEQRRQQEIEAARLSKLFAPTEVRATVSQQQRPIATNATSGAAPNIPAEAPPADPNALQNMQDRKLAFVNGAIDRRTVSSDRLVAPPSPYIIQAGTVIPAALITGIQSDLPGQITGQITQHVYDTPTGKFLLIPQGSRLIGQYDSQIAFGQKRVLLVWNRLIRPDGKSIVLEHQQGADAQGFSGLEDDVDYHWWDLAKAAALSTVLGIGTDLGSSAQQNDIVTALRRGSQDTLNNTGQQLVRRQLNVQPTLTIRQGFPVRVIVNRDLVLEPYLLEARQ